QDQRRLLTVNPETRAITVETDGWHEFAFDPAKANGLPQDLHVEQVSVAGDFNNWSATATPLKEFGPRWGWRRIMVLPDGVHHFRFVVNGCIWVEDPSADSKRRQPDGRGGFNSGILVGDDAAAFGAPLPDHVDIRALKHVVRRREYLSAI